MDSTHKAGPSSESEPQVGTPVASEPNPSKYVNLVKKLINHQAMVTIGDGRSFFGSLYCIDKQGNILLKDAVEYHVDNPSSVQSRAYALILIPITCQKSCYVDCTLEEQLEILWLG